MDCYSCGESAGSIDICRKTERRSHVEASPGPSAGERPNENDEFRTQQKLPDAEMPPPPDTEARSRQPDMTYSNSDTLTTVPTLEQTQTPVAVSVSTAPSPTVVRRSTRVSKPPDKLKL